MPIFSSDTKILCSSGGAAATEYRVGVFALSSNRFSYILNLESYLKTEDVCNDALPSRNSS